MESESRFQILYKVTFVQLCAIALGKSINLFVLPSTIS